MLFVFNGGKALGGEETAPFRSLLSVVASASPFVSRLCRRRLRRRGPEGESPQRGLGHKDDGFVVALPEKTNKVIRNSLFGVSMSHSSIAGSEVLRQCLATLTWQGLWQTSPQSRQE